MVRSVRSPGDLREDEAVLLVLQRQPAQDDSLDAGLPCRTVLAGRQPLRSSTFPLPELLLAVQEDRGECHGVGGTGREESCQSGLIVWVEGVR